MDFINTDGNNPDFVLLCRMLDNYLNEVIGSEKQQEQYNQFNTLEDIHDVMLIYEDDQPVACVGFKYFDTGIAEVKRVFVRKEYRGKGLSKQLMAALENRAKKSGYKSLLLETGLPLTAAAGLYQKIGFRKISNYGQYKNREESICMQKDI